MNGAIKRHSKICIFIFRLNVAPNMAKEFFPPKVVTNLLFVV
jgi:hypothetical protein